MDISIKKRKIILKAYESALNSPCLKKHGCVAVLNGKIIAQANNDYRSAFKKNKKFQMDGDGCSIHAEMAVMRIIGKVFKNINYKKIDIYVIRIGGNGKIVNSEPCADCAAVLKDFNIKKIFYSNKEGNIISTKIQEYSTNHRSSGRRNFSSYNTL